MRPNKPRWRFPLVSLAALSCAASLVFAEGSGQVYKWVDDKGVVHYGDSVPPEYAQADRSVLNAQGVEVGHVEGSRSAAQLAAQAQVEESAKQRAQHDQFLLTTYTSTKDIEQLRDERLQQMDAQIKASSTYIDNLGSRLAGLQERAMRFKPYSQDPGARKMPDDLADELVRTLNETHAQRVALEAKRKEQSNVQLQFQSDIERFRELTARAR